MMAVFIAFVYYMKVEDFCLKSKVVKKGKIGTNFSSEDFTAEELQ